MAFNSPGEGDFEEGLQGALRFQVPAMADWYIEYALDHEGSDITVTLHGNLVEASFSSDSFLKEVEIPSKLRDSRRRRYWHS